MASGLGAANVHEHMSSEGGKIGGIASMKKKKESRPPRDANYKMARERLGCCE
jgi:hypothetical protein